MHKILTEPSLTFTITDSFESLRTYEKPTKSLEMCNVNVAAGNRILNVRCSLVNKWNSFCHSVASLFSTISFEIFFGIFHFSLNKTSNRTKRI